MIDLHGVPECEEIGLCPAPEKSRDKPALG
jgi:hypothetical protein